MSHLWQSLPTLLLGITLGWSYALKADAAPPETTPNEVVAALEQIETAANDQDLSTVMEFYSPDFTNTDGFDRKGLEDALEQLWEQYSNLNYRIEVQSWEAKGDGVIIETLTYVNGVQARADRALNLDSVMRSRQHFENGQIISQEILSERNQLTSGDNPPTVTVLLPEQIATGETYNFDAIVEEPLGEQILLGAALEEGVTDEDFYRPRPPNFQVLSAGGLFKLGDAYNKPDNRWVSAVLIRSDGLVVVTRRLRIED
ncbi:MAG: nuclear transport factor 2 family protein [Leptolyngbyaceae cyanobacterium MO_188.B28]|nr:nuclear transport factor 2 family protein [Leptolyngbyaceae cyanobacterium MO_188.B28]